METAQYHTKDYCAVVSLTPEKIQIQNSKYSFYGMCIVFTASKCQKNVSQNIKNLGLSVLIATLAFLKIIICVTCLYFLLSTYLCGYSTILYIFIDKFRSFELNVIIGILLYCFITCFQFASCYSIF
jgi:hypothetical protein